jgi:hypothetical protein
MNNTEKLNEYNKRCIDIANTIDDIILLMCNKSITESDRVKLMEVAENQATNAVLYNSDMKAIFNAELKLIQHGN